MLSVKDKRFFPVFVGLLLLFAVIGLIITYPKNVSEKNSKTNSSDSVQLSGKLQICPDAWYSDKMPQVTEDKGVADLNRQYFVINGERKEMAKYDLDWIRANCLIKGPVNVY